MKQVYLILALVLGLVLIVGSPAFCGVLPGEDWDGPTNELDGGGSGGEDDDHPWGGDRIIGGGDPTYDKYTRVSAITGTVSIDLFLNSMIIMLAPSEVVTPPTRKYPTWEKRSAAVRYSSYLGRSSRAAIREEVGR